MTAVHEPVLTSTDWNEEWKRLQSARGKADDPAVWDARAESFPVKHGDHSGYVKRFLQLAGVQAGEAVLDMGCGTGALATPLAQAGCTVIACDFSQKMLDKMTEDQRSLGVTGVQARRMSWSDDWDACGVAKNSVDVAIASRSIATDDLQEALLKMNTAARRRACITLSYSPSPRADEQLLAAAGLPVTVGRDFLYAFNILAAIGLKPEVSYIESARTDAFASPDDALRRLAAIASSAASGLVGDDLIAAIPEKLKPWLDERLVRDGDSWRLREPRVVTWAFIAWDTKACATGL